MTMQSKAPLAIRPARTDDPSEVDRLYDICLRTGDNGGTAEELTQDPRLLGEVYLGAYLRFEPELAFVLEDADGTAVGYVLGARDTVTFEEILEKSWWPTLRDQYPLGSFTAGSLDEALVAKMHSRARTNPAAIAGFPAHLHVDVLPADQGGGNGKRLLETLFTALRDRGTTGVHLGVSPENTHAIGFYNHLGFHHLDGGLFGLAL